MMQKNLQNLLNYKGSDPFSQTLPGGMKMLVGPVRSLSKSEKVDKIIKKNLKKQKEKD
jgi:hypothetical protein